MTSKLQPYLKYKDSGIDWLNNIPGDWKIFPFKKIFKLSNERVEDNPLLDVALSVSGYRGVEPRNIDSLEGQMPSENIAKYRIIRKGQLAVNTMWLNFSGLGVSSYEGYISPAYRAYNIDKTVDKRFVHHLLRSPLYIQKYTSLLYGLRPNSLQVKNDDFEKIEILVPPIETQKKIAVFLDEKTKIIDELILKKEKMIGLLREKRAALITRAVTKGLDPKAKMKPSGVDWLGHIPEGWQICRLGQVGLFSASGIDKKIVKGESMVKIINYIDVYRSKDFRLVNKDYMVVSASKEKIKVNQVNKGDLIFTPSSEVIEEIGLAALVDDNLENTAFSYHVLRFQFQKLVEFNNSYKKYLTNNLFVLSQFSSRAQGSIRKTLSRINFKEVIILVPSLKEQKQIADYLDTQSSKIDRATEILKSQNKQLKEYRSSLIYSAVTGKIKV